MESRIRPVLALAAILFVFVVISSTISVQRAPWLDEGIFADSSSNLALHGIFGTTAWHTRLPNLVPDLPRVDRYTYWHLPVYLVSLAGVFRIFGFSIVVMRMYSVFWGCVLIVSWYFFVSRLPNVGRRAGLLAALFVGVDATITLAAATGRPDCMVAALGAAGMAAFMVWRERDLGRAILLCAACEALALFCHPIAVVHAFTAVVLVLIMDWRRLRPRHMAIAALPVAVALAGWGIYIAQAPEIFRGQFFGHISHRMGGLAAPLRTLFQEFTVRWAIYYWGPTWPDRVKAIYPVSYLAGMIFLLISPAVRRRTPALRIPGMLALTAFVVLGSIDTQKWPSYSIHNISYLAAAVGCTVGWLLESRWRVVAGGLASVVLLLQLGGSVYKASQKTNEESYLPAVRYVQQHTSPGAFVIGPVELLFGLGRDFHLEDDSRLGARIPRAPEMVLRGPVFATPEQFHAEEPETERFINRRLGSEYARVWTDRLYSAYMPAMAPDNNLQASGRANQRGPRGGVRTLR